jgi:hypothetical protein
MNRCNVSASRILRNEVCREANMQRRLDVSVEELVLLNQLLEDARTRLLAEIHHPDRRSFREDLWQRLAMLDRLLARCGS